MSLLWRILLPIMGLLVILMSAASYVSYQQSADALEQAVINHMQGEAHALKRMITYILKETAVSLDRASNTENFQSFFQTFDANSADQRQQDRINAGLIKMLSEQQTIDRFNVFNDRGIIIASSLEKALGTNLQHRTYFTEAMAGKIHISKPFQSSITGKGMIILSAPVNNEGQVLGVISAVLSLEKLYKLAFAAVSVYGKGYASATNDQGHILVHANQDYLFKDNLPTTAEYKRMASMPDGNTEFINKLGKPSMAFFVKEPTTDMTLIVQSANEDAFAGLDTLGQNTFVMTAFGVTLGIGLLMIVVLPLIRGLKHSVVYAEAVAGGKLNEELAVSKGKELGVLACALRTIPTVLKSILVEYRSLVDRIGAGDIEVQGDATKFSGDFAELVDGTNAILRQYQGILHALTVPVIVLNKDLRVSWLNNAAKAMVGDDYLGKTSEEVMAFEAVEASHNALSIAATNLEPTSAEVVAHPKGIIHEISYTAIPFTDEHGKLSTMVQVITDLTEIKSAQRTIIEIAGEAQDISNRVASSSLQLAKQVGDVSRGAEIQRERATVTATAMEEMNATVLEVARNAGEASQQAEVVQIRAGEGTELVSQVVNAIMQVNVMASELESTMQELGEQAENIGSVMNVISDIADQTNLLALNAAIEAARAGEAGRGFAVVADEVRKLAEKTMSATVEVGISIQGIQDAAQRNLQRVGEATIDVARATELASVSGEALADILALVNANALLISSIATAAEEQSVAAEEINHAVEDINMIAIETAEGTEQSSVAVQDLTQMAEDLRELLARLQHRDDAA